MISTIGAKPACLVNASVTYVGDDQIYAFGGFDQYTDEGICPQSLCASVVTCPRESYKNLVDLVLTSLVYNHVLRLNLVTRQWNLVDNYGDIPGVRMGMHTPRVLLSPVLTFPRTHRMSLARQ